MSPRRTVLATIVAGLLAIVPTSAQEEGPRAQPKKRFWPHGGEWKHAAWTALKDPGTWAPAGGAAVIAAGGWDRQISDWASKSTPIFGSIHNAEQWSDWLRASSDAAMIGTALAVHDEEHPWRLRGKTLLVEEVGAIASTSLTSLLKSATGRERPDGSDTESFPSGHASRAFAYAAASRRNLEATTLGEGWRIGLTVGFETMAIGCGWARVEAKKHFPTDVLAGAALGNYVGLFFHDAFLGTGGDTSVSLDLDPKRPSFAVAMVF